MNKIKILNTEPKGYSEKARNILLTFSDLDEMELDYDGLLDRISQYDALIVRLGYFIGEEVLSRAIGLKAIVTATTGLNHIDVEYAKDIGIEILSLRGERDFLDTITATAEHTMALLLSLIRNVPSSFKSVLEGRWDRDAFKGHELGGKKIGIIGFGRLGSMVARYAKSFGMTVFYADVENKQAPLGIKRLELDELLRISDMVTLHVHLSRETNKLLGEHQFARMKKGAWLINTSRGELIDEAVLLMALKSGHLAGAALDVLSGEVSEDAKWVNHHPLVRYATAHSNLILTPHIGGATYESMEKTEIFIANKLKSFFVTKTEY